MVVAELGVRPTLKNFFELLTLMLNIGTMKSRTEEALKTQVKQAR